MNIIENHWRMKKFNDKDTLLSEYSMQPRNEEALPEEEKVYRTKILRLSWWTKWKKIVAVPDPEPEEEVDFNKGEEEINEEFKESDPI